MNNVKLQGYRKLIVAILGLFMALVSALLGGTTIHDASVTIVLMLSMIIVAVVYIATQGKIDLTTAAVNSPIARAIEGKAEVVLEPVIGNIAQKVDLQTAAATMPNSTTIIAPASTADIITAIVGAVSGKLPGLIGEALQKAGVQVNPTPTLPASPTVSVTP